MAQNITQTQKDDKMYIKCPCCQHETLVAKKIKGYGWLILAKDQSNTTYKLEQLVEHAKDKRCAAN